MGFLQDIGRTIGDFKDFGDELMSIKDDVMSSVQGVGDDAKSIVDEVRGKDTSSSDESAQDSDTSEE